MAERALDGVHHFQRPLLAGGREGAVNVSLAQSFAQVAIDEVHAASPTRLQRLCPSQSMAEEIEIFFLEIRAQIARRAVQHPPAQVCLPVLQRMLLQHLFQAAKIIRRSHNVVLGSWRIHPREISLPIERRRQLRDLRQGHFVVEISGVAALHDVHGGFGHVGFHGQHRGGIIGSLLRVFAGQSKHLACVLLEFLADLHRLGVVIQIKFAPRHAHAALVHESDYPAGIVKILRPGKSEHRRASLRIA